MTIHIQRSVEKELPTKDGEYLTNEGSLNFINQTWIALFRHQRIKPTWWLQPVEIPDGEVTVSDEDINAQASSYGHWITQDGFRRGSEWMREKLTARHLAEKARAVDGLQKEIERLKEYEWMYKDLLK